MINLTDFIKNYSKQIMEGTGVYDGAEELGKHIIEQIKENNYKEKIVIDCTQLNFKNIFCDTIFVHYNDKNLEQFLYEKIDGAGYLYKNTKKKIFLNWDFDNKKFNFITIYIFSNDNNLELSKIVHELNHAYEDYKYRVKNPDKTLQYYLDSIPYKEFKDGMLASSQFRRIVSTIEYMSTKPETRSFVAQAMTELKENIKKYSNYNEAIEYQQQNNEVFKAVVTLKIHIEKCKRTNSTRESLCEQYRSFYKDTKLSNNKIMKLLEHKVNKLYDSLCKHVKTILLQYYGE